MFKSAFWHKDHLIRVFCAAYCGTVVGIAASVEIGNPDPAGATAVLKAEGYKDIKITGRAPYFECAGYHKTAFTAAGQDGSHVHGNVCQLIGGKPTIVLKGSSLHAKG